LNKTPDAIITRLLTGALPYHEQIESGIALRAEIDALRDTLHRQSDRIVQLETMLACRRALSSGETG
jgi:hypothetical protein